MMFKNTVRLLMANFSTVWKLILYYLVILGIIVGLMSPFFGIIGSSINATGDLSKIGELLTTFNVSVNFIGFVGQLNILIASVLESILTLFATNVWVAIYLSVLLLYVVPVLFGLADLPVGQSLFGYMSSLTKYSFVGSYVSMLGRSIRFQLFKNLTYLPFNILIAAIFVLTLKLATVGGLMVYFLPIVILVPFILLTALKRTLLSGWMPAKVVYDCNMFVAFGKGLKAVFKRFFRVFSTALVMTVIVFAFSYLFGTYALLVIIPVAMAMFYVFEMVTFYSSQGMRFYVDLDTIVKPKLLEECDSFKKVKHVI